jgi:hypothetical protein
VPNDHVVSLHSSAPFSDSHLRKWYHPKRRVMKEPPKGFALDQIGSALLQHWGIRARELDYLPVGFGAHHWRASDGSLGAYFLALHDLHPDAEGGFSALAQALETAHWLHRWRAGVCRGATAEPWRVAW